MTGRITPLYIVCSPLRGVGKTLVSRLLIEVLLIDNRRVAAFDLADEGPQLVDYLPEFTTIADISDTRNQVVLFDKLIADQDSAKIIDLSHRLFDNFFAIVKTIDFFKEAQRHFIKPLILFVMTPDPKSLKAYAGLRDSAKFREWFTAASVMPVRNATTTIGNDRESVANSELDFIDIPVFELSLKPLIDEQSFSFTQFWRKAEAARPIIVDDVLFSWLDHVFHQFRDLELWLTGQRSPNFTSPPAPLRRTAPLPPQLDGNSQCEAVVDEHSASIPEEILKFAPKKKRRIEGGPVHQFGPAILDLVQKIADLSTNDKAREDELSHQLQAAQDRISKLEADVGRFENRAVSAEKWLERIRQHIEKNFLGSRTTDPPPNR